MISLLGTPGAGKTTQTKLLAEYLDCPWFSQGELIRQHATGQARQDMLEGKIINDEVTLKILADALANVDIKNQECVVEGSPRTLRQARWWEERINDGDFRMTGFVHLVVDESIANQRLLKRGRMDDHEKVVKKRFSEYYHNTGNALEYLRTKGFPVYEVDASSSIEEVAKRIHKVLGV
jgi:adenylate kinase